MSTEPQPTNDESTHAHWKFISTRGSKAVQTPQGHPALPGVTNITAGCTQLAVSLVVMPPGGKANGHLHTKHESVIFVLEGHVVTFMGKELEQAVQGPGDFLFIPAGMEHLPANLSMEKRVVAVVSRADPNFNESLELRPHMDEIAAELIPALRKKHEAGELPEHWREVYDEFFRFPEQGEKEASDAKGI
ncbi:MAG TPA: cupin domain-containing protein [Candidatus Saccharimonadales bacterium]|nr:cupin domain-containing protein [Candidatus Saccharimonadales bacterium]